MSEYKVREFMEAAGQVTSRPEGKEAQELIAFRISLIDEEYDELIQALHWGDLRFIAKEIADLVYVAVGTAVALGIPYDEVFDVVHRSNMSKFEDADVREDGKVLKGPKYQGPEAEIERLLK